MWASVSLNLSSNDFVPPAPAQRTYIPMYFYKMSFVFEDTGIFFCMNSTSLEIVTDALKKHQTIKHFGDLWNFNGMHCKNNY